MTQQDEGSFGCVKERQQATEVKGGACHATHEQQELTLCCVLCVMLRELAA